MHPAFKIPACHARALHSRHVAMHCVRRARQSMLLLELVIASALVGYGAIALGWRLMVDAAAGL